MSGILKHMDIFPLSVGGWKDHVHVFYELPPAMSISNIMRDLKSSSSKWINDNKLVAGKFNWQDGYGAFSYSRSQRDTVINYIIHQEKHHRKKTFREEYLEMLHKFGIEFKNEYLFEFYVE